MWFMMKLCVEMVAASLQITHEGANVVMIKGEQKQIPMEFYFSYGVTSKTDMVTITWIHTSTRN